MRHTIVLLSLIALSASALATPVDQPTALTAATHFMQRKGLIKSTDPLKPYKGEMPTAIGQSLYVFNIDTTGFVLVSADDRCYPVIGYSMNGSFNYAKLPDNMKAWLKVAATRFNPSVVPRVKTISVVRLALINLRTVSRACSWSSVACTLR